MASDVKSQDMPFGRRYPMKVARRIGSTVIALLVLAGSGSAVSAQRRSGTRPQLPPSTAWDGSVAAGTLGSRDTVAADTVRLLEWRFVGEVALGTAASLALVPLDGRVRSWMQDPARQRSAALDHSVSVLTPLGTAVPLVASAALYGVGLLSGSRAAADVGLHVSEGMLSAGAVTTVLKILVGRQRPYVDPHDPNAFGRGRLIDFESGLQSFPSGHTTVAFAFAGALTEEVKTHWPGRERWVGPVTFATAAGVAFARMYRDKHWASDVLGGAVVGTLVGRRVVRSLHTGGAGPFSRVDPILLPRGDGGVVAGVSVTFRRARP